MLVKVKKGHVVYNNIIEAIVYGIKKIGMNPDEAKWHEDKARGHIYMINQLPDVSAIIHERQPLIRWAIVRSVLDCLDEMGLEYLQFFSESEPCLDLIKEKAGGLPTHNTSVVSMDRFGALLAEVRSIESAASDAAQAHTNARRVHELARSIIQENDLPQDLAMVLIIRVVAVMMSMISSKEIMAYQKNREILGRLGQRAEEVAAAVNATSNHSMTDEEKQNTISSALWSLMSEDGEIGKNLAYDLKESSINMAVSSFGVELPDEKGVLIAVNNYIQFLVRKVTRMPMNGVYISVVDRDENNNITSIGIINNASRRFLRNTVGELAHEGGGDE